MSKISEFLFSVVNLFIHCWSWESGQQYYKDTVKSNWNNIDYDSEIENLVIRMEYELPMDTPAFVKEGETNAFGCGSFAYQVIRVRELTITDTGSLNFKLVPRLISDALINASIKVGKAPYFNDYRRQVAKQKWKIGILTQITDDFVLYVIFVIINPTALCVNSGLVYSFIEVPKESEPDLSHEAIKRIDVTSQSAY